MSDGDERCYLCGAELPPGGHGETRYAIPVFEGVINFHIGAAAEVCKACYEHAERLRVYRRRGHTA